VKDRDYGALFTLIKDGDATGDAEIAFIQQQAAVKLASC